MYSSNFILGDDRFWRADRTHVTYSILKRGIHMGGAMAELCVLYISINNHLQRFDNDSII